MCSSCQLPHDCYCGLPASKGLTLWIPLCHTYAELHAHTLGKHMWQTDLPLCSRHKLLAILCSRTEEITKMSVPLSQGTLSQWGVLSSLRLWLTWHATVYATVASEGSSLTSVLWNIYGNPWQTICRCLRTRCNRCCCRTPGQRHGFIFKVLVWINVLCHFPRFSLSLVAVALPFPSIYTNFWCYFALLSVFLHKERETTKRNCLFRQPFCYS